jgi:cytoskeletal protein CcmA (bactofilin family)
MAGETTMAAPAAKTSTDGGALTAFIDQGSSFEGKLSFKDTVRIDGSFTGEIASENTLIVGESGEIEATIRSKTVIVSGSVTGDVVASRKLVMHKTARLEGNVETPCLVMEEGALFNGHVKMADPASGKSAAVLKAVEGGSKTPEAPKTTTTLPPR